MKKSTRIIETSTNDKQKSVVTRDELVDPINPMPELDKFTITNLFFTKDSPITVNSEHNDEAYDINLPPGSFRLLVCRIPPTQYVVDTLKTAGMEMPDKLEDFGMHKTPSVDFMYLTKGEVKMILDSGEERIVKAGDFVVQHAAAHTWINYGPETCEFIGVMVGVEGVEPDSGLPEKK